MKKRKLFCEISPLTYKISEQKGILLRSAKDLLTEHHLAKTRAEEPLPYCIYKHNSLIRRRLGNVNMQLQENKAVTYQPVPESLRANGKRAGSCRLYEVQRNSKVISQRVPTGSGLCKDGILKWIKLFSSCGFSKGE